MLLARRKHGFDGGGSAAGFSLRQAAADFRYEPDQDRHGLVRGADRAGFLPLVDRADPAVGGDRGLCVLFPPGQDQYGGSTQVGRVSNRAIDSNQTAPVCVDSTKKRPV